MMITVNKLVLLASFVSLMPAGQAQDNPLHHTSWKLSQDKGKATISFEGNSYSIKGCNSIGGAYTVEGGRIVADGPARSTMMACLGDGEKLDTSLTALIAKNQSFRIDRDTLTLVGQDGVEWVFKKEPLPSASAATKFIYVASETKDCTGVARMKCLQVRESPDQPWRLHHGGIIGFEHQPGTEYKLRIKEDRIPRPAADQSSIVWYLDLIVEQKVVKKTIAPR